MAADDIALPFDDDVDFNDAAELQVQGISQERWDRARDHIDVRDTLHRLHDRRGNPISCPFHGRDSKPSFNIYLQTNTCFCWGCPDGDGYWDNVKIVSRTLEVSRPQALRWLEREFSLPALADEAEAAIDLDDEGEEPEEEPGYELEFRDLAPDYIKVSAAILRSKRETKDAVPVALALVERYFTAKKDDDPLPLARIIGAEATRALLQKHQGR